MIENGHSFYNRCSRTSKDTVDKILITLCHISCLRFTSVYLWIDFSDPIIIQPTVAPVYTYLEIILRCHLLHFTQQDVIFMRLESPFDKEAVYLGYLSRQYLIFDIIGIQIRLHPDLRISDCRNLMPSFTVYQISVITQRLSSGC